MLHHAYTTGNMGHASYVLVVGGGGFIGQHIVAALAGSGRKLRVMDFASPPATLPSSVDWVSGSITDSTLVASAADGCDAVIFLANASLPGSSQGDMSREAMGHVGITLSVAEICKDLGVKQFLFASSGGTVYGYDAPETGGLDEDGPTQPRNGYGVSKLAIEHYLRLMGISGPMRTLSLRISNPYGEGQRALRAQGVVASAMQHAINDTVMPVWGDGSVSRDFIHVTDVALAFLAGLSYEGPSSVINIGSGKAVTINQIIALTRRETGRDLQVDYQKNRMVDVHRNALSIRRAALELSWTPQISLDEGLKRTARWWLDNI